MVAKAACVPGYQPGCVGVADFTEGTGIAANSVFCCWQVCVGLLILDQTGLVHSIKMMHSIILWTFKTDIHAIELWTSLSSVTLLKSNKTTLSRQMVQQQVYGVASSVGSSCHKMFLDV